MNNNDGAGKCKDGPNGEPTEYRPEAPPRTEEQVGQELQKKMFHISKIKEKLYYAEEECQETVKRCTLLTEKTGKTESDLSVISQLELRFIKLQPQILQLQILLNQLEAEARVLENEYNMFVNHKIDFKAITERIYDVMALQRAQAMEQMLKNNMPNANKN